MNGLSEVIVCDNGSVFTSNDFKIFTGRNGIRYISTAPYHPSSYGLVEKVVQAFKQGMKKQGKGSVETKLARFIISYRTSPQTTTGETPSQLRWGHNLRTQIDLLKPNTVRKVEAAQGINTINIRETENGLMELSFNKLVPFLRESNWKTVVLFGDTRTNFWP